MMIEKAIAAAMQPIVEMLVALKKRVEQMQLTPGPQGEPGRDADPVAVAKALASDKEFIALTKGQDGTPGKDGRDGKDGAGIDVPQWEAGAVYRQGTVVTANIGQHFRALRDTASSPDEPEHWARIGAGGLRYRGAYKAETAYENGDLFTKDFGTFAIINGAPVLFGPRGSIGKQGERGPQGEKGKDGKDGSTIIGAQVEGFKLVLVQDSVDGIDHIEADFGPAIRGAIDKERDE